jgi:membrane protease YdiL (CAAX protease family)
MDEPHSSVPEQPSSPPPEAVMARPVGVSGPPLPPTIPYARAARGLNPLELPDVPLRAAKLDLGLIVLVMLIVPFGSELVAAAVLNVEPGADLLSMVPVLIIRKWSDALLAGGLAAYLLVRNHLPAASFGLRTDRWLPQLGWAAVGLAGIYGYMIVAMMVLLFWVALFPQLQHDLEHRLDMVRDLPVHNLSLSILLLVPVAIHEEVLFRGLLLPYVRRWLGSWWPAVLLVSVAFGSLHLTQGVLGAIQVFGVGVILCLIFIFSRSLSAVMIAHFLFDLLQFQLIRVIPLPGGGGGAPTP